ncbi:hypothetical protein AVEN_210920-1 [Araneus ventricosus]|uniref:Uncharacterized protein n=1 Tax=Araneus ventricosus TaxID=182803 RepID=A0A4Y2PW89_ARAVE|nr:hypothetical protein AVEN_210920-1 [Araneus ventricosus]
MRCRPRHLTEVENYQVSPKVASRCFKKGRKYDEAKPHPSTKPPCESKSPGRPQIRNNASTVICSELPIHRLVTTRYVLISLMGPFTSPKIKPLIILAVNINK